MMAERANVSELSNSLYRNKNEFFDRMTSILKVRKNSINNSLRAVTRRCDLVVKDWTNTEVECLIRIISISPYCPVLGPGTQT